MAQIGLETSFNKTAEHKIKLVAITFIPKLPIIDKGPRIKTWCVRYIAYEYLSENLSGKLYEHEI